MERRDIASGPSKFWEEGVISGMLKIQRFLDMSFGSGSAFSFWEDTWASDKSILVMFLLLYTIAFNCQATAAEVWY